MGQPYPPPPPPRVSPPDSTDQRGFHGPQTNWFLGIRARLAAFESPFTLSGRNSLRNGLLVSLILAASIGFVLSFFIELALLPSVGGIATIVFIAPLIEELSKALGMLAVAFFMWKALPNRRYGAVLGAAAGLGFGVAESCLYIYGYAVTGDGVAILSRIIITPLMHPLWSAFVGMGVFTLVAYSQPRQPGSSKPPLWLPFLFLLAGLCNHIVWNSFAVGLALLNLGYLPLILDIMMIFPTFALMLRDFLGGHFNFQDFLKHLPEPPSAQTFIPFPPPPPPINP